MHDTDIIEKRFAMVMKNYGPKLKKFAWQHYHETPGMRPEDMLQEIYIVIHRAVQTYQPQTGIKFNTYMWNCVKNRRADMKLAANRIFRGFEDFLLEGGSTDDMYEEDGWLDSLNRSHELSIEDLYCIKETIVERGGDVALIA